MTDEHMSETTMGGADAPSPASPACEGETPALTPLSLPTEAGTAPEEHPAPPAAAGPPSRPGLTTGMNALMLEAAVVETLRTIFDPEIPVNIYDLGLIYAVQVDPETKGVHVKMTLTSPTCPVAGTLPGEVEQKVAAVPGVSAANIELVWDPPWDPSVMSDEAKLLLNLW